MACNSSDEKPPEAKTQIAVAPERKDQGRRSLEHGVTVEKQVP
jgi:hypothetical protein